MNPQTSRRKKVLVDRELQARLVMRLGAILAADFALFVALAIVLPAAIGYVLGASEWGVFESLTRWDLLTTAVLLPLACAFLCYFGQGMREAHRIAGPIWHFRKVFRDLAALRIPRGVSIRSHDYAKESAKDLDASVKRLHSEIGELKRLAAPVDGEDGATAEARLERIRDRLDSFTLLDDAIGGVVDPIDASAESVRAPAEETVAPR